MTQSECSKIYLFDPGVKKAAYDNFQCKLTKDCKGKVEPLIVIPHHTRTQNKSIDSLWKRAEKELAGAEKVTFIGYSFPCYDKEVIDLLKNHTNPQAEIEIVDYTENADDEQIRNAECEWRKKLKDIFPSRDIDRINIKLDGFEKYLENYQERDLAKDKKRTL